MRHGLRSCGSLPSRLALGLTLALCAAAPSAALADDAAATAQALFNEATELKKQEKWAEACPKFESSYKLDPALGTLLNLANCYEKLNLLASAWARWEEAYSWAVKNNDDRAEYAQTQRDALVPRLPKLTITVKNPVPALSVERDRSPISAPMYNSALPVDPGEHRVFVKRGDEVLKTEKVSVVEAQTAEITLDLAAIERAAPPPPPPKKDKPVVVVGVSPALRKVGWATFGVGLGAVAAAGIVEGLALSAKADADSPQNCLNKICTPQGVALVEDAKRLAEGGQWLGVAGLLVTAVGVTLLIVTPSQVLVNRPADGKDGGRPEARRDVWVAPWAVADPGAPAGAPRAAGGLVVGGTL